MIKKPFCIFLLTGAFVVFILHACNSGDRNPVPPSTNSTTTKQDPDTVSDLLAEKISQSTPSNLDTSNLIKKTLALMAAFDSASVNFRRDSFEIEEKTTEGGELIAIHSPSTKFIRIDGELAGEMGKLEFSFYMINKDSPQLSGVIYKHTEYDKPMYEKDMKMSPPVITYEIYSDDHLVAVLDKQRRKQPIAPAVMAEKDRDTKQFVKDYLRQAHIIK